MKKLVLLMFGLFMSLSYAFAATTPYATLKYAKGTVVVNVIAPTAVVAGRDNFEFKFVDTNGAAITPLEIKDVTGTSKMTSMERKNGSMMK
jgi:hypothetical protein